MCMVCDNFKLGGLFDVGADNVSLAFLCSSLYDASEEYNYASRGWGIEIVQITETLSTLKSIGYVIGQAGQLPFLC